MKTSTMVKIVIILIIILFVGSNIFVSFNSPKQKFIEEKTIEINN